MSRSNSSPTVLINGASRGIGLAAASALLSSGARVVITGRDEASLDRAVAELGSPAELLAIPGSSGDPEHRAEAIARAIAHFGSLDVLVNNAGVNPAYDDLLRLDDSVMHKVLAANVEAPLGWIKQAHRRWMGANGGAVVNVASVAALAPQAGLGAYAISKAALVHMTRQLAFELGPKVRVNSVSPGLVKTRFAAGLWHRNEEQLAAHYPSGRLGEPEDVGRAIAFLALDDSSWVTGANLVIDGGLLSNDSTGTPGLDAGAAVR